MLQNLQQITQKQAKEAKSCRKEQNKKATDRIIPNVFMSQTKAENQTAIILL